MANQQHLNLLRQGTQVWKAWRKQHPEISPNVSEANLSGINLRYADLSDTNLRETNLSRADLRRADLRRADLSAANLKDADLRGADLRRAYLRGVDLNDYSPSNIKYGFIHIITTNLSGANLSGANLWGANLRYANLSKANLSEANLSEANLSDTDLSDTNLSGADLRDTNLKGTNLNGTDLSEAKVGKTTFAGLDLRQVRGLEMVIHRYPSHIGIDTLERSEGNIPDVFLRGAGLSDISIAYAYSLKSHPIEYYTCFISYSSQDGTFAKRLHADLQQQGVRCWFAPHDMRPGDVILARIDEAIRLSDKLVLILSEHSVESNWVEMEVTSALTKEVIQGSQMLFPLRLDDTIKTSRKPWAISLWEKRHIANFVPWKDHDAYQQAFVHLLNHLKASEKA